MEVWGVFVCIEGGASLISLFSTEEKANKFREERTYKEDTTYVEMIMVDKDD